MTKEAMKLCYDAHKDQVDKSGLPYVFHPIHLPEQMEDEETTIVSLLHDVVEDSNYTFKDLEVMGFSARILAALKLLTHEKGVSYMEYIAKIKEDPIARIIKLADLAHNSDLSRLDEVDEKAIRRATKYAKAIQLLNKI